MDEDLAKSMDMALHGPRLFCGSCFKKRSVLVVCHVCQYKGRGKNGSILCRGCGEHYCKNECEVCHISGKEITLPEIEKLISQKHLGIADPRISKLPAGISKFTDLASIHLGSTKINNIQLEHIKDLTNLTLIKLPRSISDAGLAHLRNLTNLNILILSDTKISDAGLIHLKHLSNLTNLKLCGTKISDVGLMHIKELTNLTNLSLSETKISDAGIVHLKELTNLTSLSFLGARISDAGIVHLKELTNLTWLDLDKTRVSHSGIEKLRQAMPNCTISSDFD